MPSKSKIPPGHKVKAGETYLAGEKSQESIAKEIAIHVKCIFVVKISPCRTHKITALELCALLHA